MRIDLTKAASSSVWPLAEEAAAACRICGRSPDFQRAPVVDDAHFRRRTPQSVPSDSSRRRSNIGNRTNRTVSEANLDQDVVWITRSAAPPTALARTDRGAAGKKLHEVDEWHTSPTMRPPPTADPAPSASWIGPALTR